MTIQRATLPLIRRVLTNDWNVHNPEKCVVLMEALNSVYPIAIIEELIGMLIEPKIGLAVKSWTPSFTKYNNNNNSSSNNNNNNSNNDDNNSNFDNTNSNNNNVNNINNNDSNNNNLNDIKYNKLPIHCWLHPWLPLMKSKLSIYYPEIRRKFNSFISSYWSNNENENENILNMISPWRNVFDKNSMDNFLIKSVMPKLVISLRSVLINPQNQEIITFQNVLKWHSIIPNIYFISLFRGEFFNRWLRVLINWLMLSPDLMEVTEWYSGWKSVFPDSLLEDTDIMHPFNTALNIMNIALTYDEIESIDMLKKENSKINETSYCIFLENKLNDIKMRERLNEINQDDRYTSSSSANVASAYGLGE